MTKNAREKVSAEDVEQFLESCKQALRKTGARVTQPRLSVVRSLATAGKPLSARELFDRIENDKSLPGVDQVSVYRILDTLSELDLVHQVFPSGGYVPCFHRDCRATLHVLIRCATCERIEELDVPQETLAPMLWYLQNERGFFPDEHVFQMNGQCSDCHQPK